jgi:hypothetical protein
MICAACDTKSNRDLYYLQPITWTQDGSMLLAQLRLCLPADSHPNPIGQRSRSLERQGVPSARPIIRVMTTVTAGATSQSYWKRPREESRHEANDREDGSTPE